MRVERQRIALATCFFVACLLLLAWLVWRPGPPGPRTSLHPPPGRYNRLVIADRPAAFWDMSHRGGTEPDLTGNGHVGVYRGGAPGSAVMPDGDRAIDLNRAGEYMTARPSRVFSIPTTGQLSWEAWIRPDSVQFSGPSDPDSYGYVDWMGKCQDYSPNCEWAARFYSRTNRQNRCSRLSAYVFNPEAGRGSGADWQPRCRWLRPQEWVYVVGEYQTRTTPSRCDEAYPGTISIWVDGVAWDDAVHGTTGCMSQYHTVPRAGASPLDVGTAALDTWFPGAIGKVAIYDRLLSRAQIAMHYAAMTGKVPDGSCGSVCYARFP